MTDRQDSTGQNAPRGTKALPATGLMAGLGARIPLIAAPMAGGPSTPALVLAAAEAGGLGFLAGGYKTPEQLAGQIVQVRAGFDAAGPSTPHIFGVNLFVPNPVPVDPEAFRNYAETLNDLASGFGLSLDQAEMVEDDDHWDAKLDLLVADPVSVVSFTFGLPSVDAVRRLQKAGSLVIQTVTSGNEAEEAAAIGVDGLVVQAYTGGGHSGTWTPDRLPAQVPLSELMAQVRAKVGLPLWAAGGVSSHEVVREILGQGAEAVIVGTVLLMSPESGASATYKRALGDPARSETLVTTSFSGRPARALRNGFVDRFQGLGPLGYPAIHHLTSPLRKAAAAAGDPENISIWAGTGFREAVNEPAGDILRRLAGVPG